MIFDFIDWDKKYDFILILTKKNKKPIAVLNEAFSRRLEINIDALNKLNFTVPKYTKDRLTHEKIENSYYKDIIEENMILLKCVDRDRPSNPIWQSYFIIKECEESTENESKTVQCSSREIGLNRNTITLDGMARQLKKDSVNTSDGIFDIMEQQTKWKLGYLDENAKVEHINGGTNNKYRYFEPLSKPWLSFLREDVASAFDVVIFFDTVNKLVNVYDRKSFGRHTGMVLSEENYAKNITKSTSSNDIVTKLLVYGENGIGISDVNIYGNDYLYNYDYFKQNGQMSNELIAALNKYENLLRVKDTEFKNLRNQLLNLQSQLDIKNQEMTQLNEELKALRHIQSAYMADGDNTRLKTATTNVNNKILQIGNKQNEINNLRNQITQKNNQIAQIANDIRQENAKENGNYIFTNELLEELEEFTFVDEWSNDYYVNSEALMKAGEEVLKELSVPTLEMKLNVIDLFGCAETSKYWDKISVGDFVRLFSNKLNYNFDLRIVGYTYNIDSNDLNLTLSNKDLKKDDARSIGSAIKKGAEASRIVNTKKLEWNDIRTTKDAVETFLNNALDVGRQEIIALQGKNKINIDENGIFVINKDNEDNQVCLLAGILGFTNDGWQTCNTLLDNSGLYAKYLVGQIILGEELFIQDETGQFSIVGNLLTIKDGNMQTKVQLGEYAIGKWGLKIIGKSGNVVLDENGIMQTHGFVHTDSLDSSNPIVIPFYVDSGVTEVRECKVHLMLDNFRGYSRGAESAPQSTTSSTGSHRHIMFEKHKESGVWDYNEGLYEFPSQGGGGARLGIPFKIVDYDGILPNGATPSYVYTSESTGSHAHTVPSHSHPQILGIIKGEKASNVSVKINGTIIATGINNNYDLNIESYIKKGQWNTLEISSATMGRIITSFFFKMFVTT